MSVSVSGFILPKAVFDLHVSVNCLFRSKRCRSLVRSCARENSGTMSVSGFIPETPNLNLVSVSVSGLDPQEFDLTDLR